MIITNILVWKTFSDAVRLAKNSLHPYKFHQMQRNYLPYPLFLSLYFLLFSFQSSANAKLKWPAAAPAPTEVVQMNFYYIAGVVGQAGWNDLNRNQNNGSVWNANLKNSQGNPSGIALTMVRSQAASHYSLSAVTSQVPGVPNAVWQRGIFIAQGDTMTMRFDNLDPNTAYTLKFIARSEGSNRGDSATAIANGTVKALGKILGNRGHIDSMTVMPQNGSITLRLERRGRWGHWGLMGLILEKTPGRTPSVSDPYIAHPSYYSLLNYQKLHYKGGDTALVTLTFSGPPTNLDIQFAGLKYNKRFYMSEDFDDAHDKGGVYYALPKFNARLYDDGTGQLINYRASAALNAYFGNDSVLDYRFGGYHWVMPYDFTRAIIKGWDIANHQARHDDALDYADAVFNLTYQNEYMYRKLGGYQANFYVVAQQAQAHHTPAADSLGFLGATSTNSPPAPYLGYNISTQDYSTIPMTGFVYMGRSFMLGHRPLTYYTSIIDQIRNNSVNGVHLGFGWGNHSDVQPQRQNVYDYLENTYGNEVWVASRREILEYARVKDQVDTSITISGNTVTVMLDFSQVEQSLRWKKELTLLVNADANLTGISGTDSMTSNLSTGLINLYGQKLIWDTPYPHPDSGATAALVTNPAFRLYGNHQAIINGATATSFSDSTDFGQVTLGGSKTGRFVIANSDNADLILSAATLSGAGSVPFSVFPFGNNTLMPGDSTLLKIDFTPTVAGIFSVTVQITSNDPTASPFHFEIKAEAQTATPIDTTSGGICDTLRFVSNGTWLQSSVTVPSNFSGNWNGVGGHLPAMASFSQTVSLGQPYPWPTIFAADSSQVIKAGHSVRFFKKTIYLDSLEDLVAQVRSTFSMQSEIYVNGHLLAGHYAFDNANDEQPFFEVHFSGEGTVQNGSAANKAYGWVSSDSLKNIFQPGANQIVLVLRNLGKANAVGGFSMSMEVTGCRPYDSSAVPPPLVCDSLELVSDEQWTVSSFVGPSSYSGRWSGVNGTLPSDETFQEPAEPGQPYSFPTIEPVLGSEVIRAGHGIRYFRRQFQWDMLQDLKLTLAANFDNQMELYLNGQLVAGHYQFSGQNDDLPPFKMQLAAGQIPINGLGLNKAFDFVTAANLASLVGTGHNEIILVLRNLAKPSDAGGFSLKLNLEGCMGESSGQGDTNIAEILVDSLVSDGGWSKSTYAQPSNYSGNWSGASSLPSTSTYILPAIVGQPYSFATIDSVLGAQVIKTDNNITFFRREFELTDNVGLDAHFRLTGDDGFEIYVNGTLLAREENSGSANYRAPSHSLFASGSGSFTNGFGGGDAFDMMNAVPLDNVFQMGSNEVVVVIRNKGKANDVGGFSFRMDLEKAGGSVIVKSAENKATAQEMAQGEEVRIFPNPTLGKVTVQIARASDESAEVQLYDFSGRLLETRNVRSSATFDLRSYTAGVYLFKIRHGGQVVSQKVIKN